MELVETARKLHVNHLRIYTEISLIAHVAPNGNRQKGLKLGTAKPAVNLQQNVLCKQCQNGKCTEFFIAWGEEGAGTAQKIW